jgi:hypothetical protein
VDTPLLERPAGHEESERPPRWFGWLGAAAPGVVLANFAGFDTQGRFLVRVDENSESLPALSVIGLGADDDGAQVVVAFEGGDTARPVILGRLRSQKTDVPAKALSAKVDGERLVLQADRQIELRCGDASIVLTAAGKILIRGNYVLSRSRGANRIKGAYVDIN